MGAPFTMRQHLIGLRLFFFICLRRRATMQPRLFLFTCHLLIITYYVDFSAIHAIDTTLLRFRQILIFRY